MKSESDQQDHVTEGVEVAYVGRCIVVGSVAEMGDDRIDAEKQVGSNTVDGGLTKALAGLAKVFVPGIDYGVHARAKGKRYSNDRGCRQLQPHDVDKPPYRLP